MGPTFAAAKILGSDAKKSFSLSGKGIKRHDPSFLPPPTTRSFFRNPPPAERYERASVIITTNLGFVYWTKLFGDPTLTAALLDRLTHKAHIIMCNWDSYRLKESLKRKSQAKRDME